MCLDFIEICITISLFMHPKFMRLFVVFVIFCSALYGLGRLYDRWTGGFSISNITYEKPFDPRWDLPLDATFVAEILNQPYHYLGKGHQSFVFESADGKYVIKFLKCHLVTIKPWLAWLPLFGSLETWRSERVNAKQKRLDAIFTGWKIGCELLPEDTGIIAVHMNTTESLQKHLFVTNKAGWGYTVDLDKTAFLVQHKVDMLVPTIENYLSMEKQDKVEGILTSLLKLYQHMCSIGVSDTDPQIMRNTGVSFDRPILIDVGRLKLDSRVKEGPACINEIQVKTRIFFHWLHAHYPILANYFESQISALRDTDD